MIIKLLDKFESIEIQKITTNRADHVMSNGRVRLPLCVAYQGEGEVRPATKRATCRLCGHKIKSGDQLSFYYDEEQNPWTAKMYHVHADGCGPHSTAEQGQ